MLPATWNRANNSKIRIEFNGELTAIDSISTIEQASSVKKFKRQKKSYQEPPSFCAHNINSFEMEGERRLYIPENYCDPELHGRHPELHRAHSKEFLVNDGS